MVRGIRAAAPCHVATHRASRRAPKFRQWKAPKPSLPNAEGQSPAWTNFHEPTQTPCRNARVWNHPAAARRRGLSRVPRPGRRHVSARRPSRVPRARPRPLAPHPTIIVSRCSKTRTCESATTAKPPANSASLIHPAASPSRPSRSHRKPRAKRPPPPKLTPARHHTAEVVQSSPSGPPLPPPPALHYRRCMNAVSPPLQPPLPGAPLPPTPRPSAVPAALAV